MTIQLTFTRALAESVWHGSKTTTLRKPRAANVGDRALLKWRPHQPPFAQARLSVVRTVTPGELTNADAQRDGVCCATALRALLTDLVGDVEELLLLGWLADELERRNPPDGMLSRTDAAVRQRDPGCCCHVPG